MNDSLMNCQIMAQATSRIKVGTWIANIYLRHPALCAQTAIAIDDTSHGRLILGLGVSHRPIVEGLYQEKMEKPRTFMRQYIGAIRDMAAGKELPGMAMQPRAATHRVPIYIAALALGTATLSGELADGVMLYLCPKNRLPTAVAAVEKGAAKAGRPLADIDITTGIPSCIHDDMDAAMQGGQGQSGVLRQSALSITSCFTTAGLKQKPPNSQMVRDWERQTTWRTNCQSSDRPPAAGSNSPPSAKPAFSCRFSIRCRPETRPTPRPSRRRSKRLPSNERGFEKRHPLGMGVGSTGPYHTLPPQWGVFRRGNS